MKRLACISGFLLLLVGCASRPTARSDFYFLPCAAKASVSFEGETQAGRGIHRLEVRRLAYVPPGATEGQTMMASCVIYYASDEYGPYILRVLDDCIDPLVRRASKDVVEVYFLAGAHTHIRQQWRLLGATAKLETEGEIDPQDDPRMAQMPTNKDSFGRLSAAKERRSYLRLNEPCEELMTGQFQEGGKNRPSKPMIQKRPLKPPVK